MEFPKTTKEEDKICYQEGLRIFAELRKRYSNDNCRDLDIVLNSICCALVRLFSLNVRKEDYESCGELVRQTIVKNLKENC